MKLKTTTIIAAFLLALTAKAQRVTSTSKKYIGLDIGYRFDNLNDQNLSPLNQKGEGLSYSLFYEKRKKNILKLNINYSDGLLESGVNDTFETSYYTGSFNASYLKSLSHSAKTTKFYIGLTYNLDVYYMDWFDQDAFSYSTTNGLSFTGAFTKQLNTKQFIEGSVTIPFLQYLSRPPYNGINEFIIENQDTPVNIIFDGELTSFKKYKAIAWNINYNLEISNHINWRLNYTLNIKKVIEINKVKSVSNLISTSISYKF
ncbi:hypothetical protein [Algibacter pacificus]|uniref:hypothetical protein n=1 Tax=Algibacter pacificus TaxID=2599389 RepID=UPI0011CB66EC|nr:hypothetical protein [Algibacter pacificus]